MLSSGSILTVLYWTLTKAMAAKVDAFYQWCQRRILRIHYSHHVTNAEVRRRTGCLPLSEIIRSRRLNWFGHVARASPELDHRRALYAAVHGQPRDWKRRRGRPAHTWPFLRLAPSAGLDGLEWTHSDSHAPEWGSLLMMMMMMMMMIIIIIIITTKMMMM